MLRFETAIGPCGVAWNERGISAVSLLGAPRTTMSDPPAHIREAVEAMQALLAGEPRDLRSIVLDESGIDDFRRGVYHATREIGPGETATYGELAKRIGSPDAARAVGAALGANPYPIIVPCHRVLAAGGALHGFSAPGGIVTKRRMLEIECAPGFRQVSLFG